jgi:hypothetical protein
MRKKSRFRSIHPATIFNAMIIAVNAMVVTRTCMLVMAADFRILKAV